MRQVTKFVTRLPLVRFILALAAAGLMGIVKATTRWRLVNDPAAAAAGARPVIVAFWHNRLAMMPYCWPSPEPFHMLTSAHPDGRLIAEAIRHFGIDTVAGSSTRGGSDALRRLVRSLRAGISVGITPDGPRGPRMRAGEGAIALARLSGAPILPAAVSVSRRLLLDTWDRLIVPLPLGRGAVVWGDAIHVPRDADADTVAALRQRLEDELNRISAQADELAGHPAMMPAPLTPENSANATA